MIDIRSVSFAEDGTVVFEYSVPEGQRANGMMQASMIMVPPNSPIMAERLGELYEEVERALKFFLREFEASSPPEDLEDEDLPGYDNPTERDEVRDGPLSRRLREQEESDG